MGKEDCYVIVVAENHLVLHAKESKAGFTAHLSNGILE